MSLVFSDEFNGTLGSNPPTGWTNLSLTASSVVSGGGYHGQCVVFGAGAGIRQKIGSPLTTTTVFIVSQPNGGVTTPLQWGQQTISGTTTSWPILLSLNYASDRELYIRDAGDNITCFGHAGHHYRGQESDWTFVQVDAALSPTTIGTTSALRLGASIFLNGERIAHGTSTFASPLADNMDTLLLNGANDRTTAVDEIYVYSPPLTTPIVTPNQDPARAARISQAVIESVLAPTGAAARVSQAAVEYLELPSGANARVSQAIIELVLARSGGWQVFEA